MTPALQPTFPEAVWVNASIWLMANIVSISWAQRFDVRINRGRHDSNRGVNPGRSAGTGFRPRLTRLSESCIPGRQRVSPETAPHAVCVSIFPGEFECA